MDFHSDVCVVGNGAVGKVAALGFAQAGLSVTLLVPASAPSVPVADQSAWDLRVYALNQVARSLLSSVKVWEALDSTRIAPVDAMVVNGDGVDDAGALAFDAYGARTDALAWIVEDANLNRALDAALKFAPNLRMVTATARRLVTDADQAILELDTGDQAIASLVIGADGAQSWVRGQCDIDVDYRSYGQRAIVANFACDMPHHGAAHQWFTSAEGIIALLPLPGQRVSLVWSAPDALAEILLQESAQQLAQRLAALPRMTLGALQPLGPEAVKAFPLALIRPRSIIAPRVALAGDAAHVIHPLAGQGMNLGFADVAALLRVVAGRGAQHGCGDSRILRRYARARAEEILVMQIATDGLERLFAVEFEPVRRVRNIGLDLVNKFPSLKRRLMSHALGKFL